MESLERIFSNTVFFLLCLLTLLLIFEQDVVIPFWLQPMGRMHPMVLHFPIGFVMLLLLADLLNHHIDPVSFEKINKFLLLLTAMTSTFTAIMGLFLSLEEQHTSELMTTHKWIGVGVSYFSYLLVLVYNYRRAFSLLLYSTFLAVVLAGHYGASITHGVHFLTEPLVTIEEPVFDESEPVFSSIIQPILKSKCQSCHNPEKHKGNLDISTLEKMHEGGDNGPLWTAGDVRNSALVQRVLLPEEHKDHMPPLGKVQLTEIELKLIKDWILHGANEKVTILDLNGSDSLLITLKTYIDNTNNANSSYDFPFAPKELISSLNTPYCNVSQRSPSSPAIDVTILGRHSFEAQSFENLEQINEQIVSLNMANMPVGDEVFEVIGQFPNLEKLNLNFTDITGERLSILGQCKKLKYLSLAGTAITKSQILGLAVMPKLERLYLWNTPLNPDEISELKEEFGVRDIRTGLIDTSEDLLALTPPLLKSTNNVLPVGAMIEFGHKLNGVQIRYTDDGTNPDSTSRLYQNAITFETDMTLKAIAFKEGWKNSDIVTYTFKQKGYEPQQVDLLYAPQPPYKGKGVLTLTDGEQGRYWELPYLSWIGFRETPFAAIADLGNDRVQIDSIGLSYGLSYHNRCSPPTHIELYGGNSKNDLALLETRKVKYNQTGWGHFNKTVNFQLGTETFRFYKIVAYPIENLPKWHPKKGQKGGVFVDQLFFHQSSRVEPSHFP